MNNDDKFMKGVIEVVGIAGFMVLYVLFGIHYMPIVLFLFPAAFVILGVRRGLPQGILSMGITLITTAVFIDLQWAILLFLEFIPITIILIYTIKKRRKSIEILGSSAAVFFLCSLLILSFVDNANGMNFVGQLEQEFRQLLNVQIDMFKDMGLTSYEILQTKDNLENFFRNFVLIIPAILLIASLVVSYINYSVSIYGLKKSGIGIINIPRFSRFRLPNNVVPGIIVMFLATLIIKQLDFPYYDTIVLNLVTLIGTMIYIQGLAVLDYLLVRGKVKAVFRFIFLVFTLSVAPLATIIPAIGFVDLLFDLRKLRKRKS